MNSFVPNPSLFYTVTTGSNTMLQLGSADPDSSKSAVAVYVGNDADLSSGKWQFLPTNGTNAGLIVRPQSAGLGYDPYCFMAQSSTDSRGQLLYVPVLAACNNSSLPPANGWRLSNDTIGSLYLWHNSFGSDQRMYLLPNTGQMVFTSFNALNSTQKSGTSWQLFAKESIMDPRWLTVC